MLLPRERLLTVWAGVWVPWAVRAAAEARFMLSVDYEAALAEPLPALRRRLGYIPPPFGSAATHA